MQKNWKASESNSSFYLDQWLSNFFPKHIIFRFHTNHGILPIVNQKIVYIRLPLCNKIQWFKGNLDKTFCRREQFSYSKRTSGIIIPLSPTSSHHIEFAFIGSICFDTMPQIRFQHHGVREFVRIIASCYNKPPLIFHALTQ